MTWSVQSQGDSQAVRLAGAGRERPKQSSVKEKLATHENHLCGPSVLAAPVPARAPLVPARAPLAPARARDCLCTSSVLQGSSCLVLLHGTRLWVACMQCRNGDLWPRSSAL